MESQPGSREPIDRARMIQAILVAAIVVSAAVMFFVWYSGSKAAKAEESTPVASGDLVTLNYVGKLPDGRVFDTSLWNIASNDAVYPKSLTFTVRGNDSYKPFDMIAGNYGAGGTIKGFALGIIGMVVNETRVIEVPPEEGYALNPSMLKTINLTEQIPATEVLTASQFRDSFGAEPTLLLVIPHYFWGWNVMVVANASDSVKIKHMPVIGESYYPYGDPDDPDEPEGWPVLVEDFDSTALDGTGITKVKHMIDANDVYFVKGTDIDGKAFILWDFNALDGTFVVHKIDDTRGYNAEISGRTLYFEITIVSVEPPE